MLTLSVRRDRWVVTFVGFKLPDTLWLFNSIAHSAAVGCVPKMLNCAIGIYCWRRLNVYAVDLEIVLSAVSKVKNDLSGLIPL